VDLENEDIGPSWWEDVLSAANPDAYELMSSHLQRAALADGVGEASVKNQAMASPCHTRDSSVRSRTVRTNSSPEQGAAAPSLDAAPRRVFALARTLQVAGHLQHDASETARAFLRSADPRTVVVDPYAHLSGPLTTLGLRVASG
jgi:hypothetical protein